MILNRLHLVHYRNYLNHSFDKSYSSGGWTFMDYRNDSNMNDKNTIFYGHNLLNHTAFGSLSKVFSSKKEDIKTSSYTENNQGTRPSIRRSSWIHS